MFYSTGKITIDLVIFWEWVSNNVKLGNGDSAGGLAGNGIFNNPRFVQERQIIEFDVVGDDESEFIVYVNVIDFWHDLVEPHTPFFDKSLEVRYGVPEIKKVDIEICFAAGTESPESWDVRPTALLEWDAHKGAINIMLDVATPAAKKDATDEIAEAKGKPTKVKEGVHVTHCCVKHGCKYGEPDCPVVNEAALQRYPCEQCVDGDSFFADINIEDDSIKLEKLTNLHMYHDYENDDVRRMAWIAGNNECAFLLMQGKELKVMPLDPTDSEFARVYASGFNACLQGVQENEEGGE